MANVQLSTLGSVIKTAYEGVGNTNAFTDAEKTKLASVETSASADQTDAEIETAYNNQVPAASQAEAEAGTETAIRRWSPLRVAQAIAELADGGGSVSAWGDLIGTLSDQTDLQAALDDKSDDDHTHLDATTSVAGFLSTADKTKLDGIEEAATADQTEAEIVAAYNNQVEVVSEADAEAGTGTSVRRWTPERVKQAIEALAPAAESPGSFDYVDGTLGAGNITAIDESHAGQTIDIDQNATLENTFSAEHWVELVNVGSSTITITPEASGEINGSSSPITLLPDGGRVLIACTSNAGTAPICTARGDLAGARIVGNLAGTGTVSGTLTAAQSGGVYRTSGNVTIPTTAGYNVTLIAGGAHTVTFDSTTSPAMASGDMMSIVVDDQADIHAVLVEAASKVSFT